MRPSYRLAILSTVFLITSAEVYALQPSSALKALNRHYKNVESLQADFREVFQWGLTGETVIREGSLVVTDDNRFRIETPEQLLVSDGRDIYRFNRALRQVIVEPVNSGGAPPLPRRILLDFTEGFKAAKIDKMAVAGEEGYRLDLVSKDPDEALLSDATLWITSDDLVVHRLKLVDLNGNSTTYYLSNIRFDLPVDSTVTSFTIPEGVELFDLHQ